MLAVAYGRILWLYAHDPADGLVWAVVIVDTSICLAAALLALWLRRTWIDTSGDT